MKDSRRSAPARRSSTRVVKTSGSNAVARPAPSIAIQATARRIADKMQWLALRRPHMMHLLEILVDGMLSDRRRDDDRATVDD
jgi:hypothetical protein